MLPPVQTNTKMSAFNVNMSSSSLPTRPSQKALEERKTGGKHNACYQSAHQPLLLTPKHAATSNGCKAYKARSGLVSQNRSRRGVANERVISTYCRFVSSKHSTTPVAASNHNHHAHQEVACAARQAGKPRRGGVRRRCSVEVWG